MTVHKDKTLKIFLKDIVQACAFKNVKNALLMLYPDQRRNISGICLEKDIQQSYALEYTPWSKWLGYEVSPKILKKMSKEEIATHCLWEMTFMGFTQNKIRRKLNLLEKRVEDVKTGKVKTIPFEEVMVRLKEKTKGHGR